MRLELQLLVALPQVVHLGPELLQFGAPARPAPGMAAHVQPGQQRQHADDPVAHLGAHDVRRQLVEGRQPRLGGDHEEGRRGEGEQHRRPGERLALGRQAAPGVGRPAAHGASRRTGFQQ